MLSALAIIEALLSRSGTVPRCHITVVCRMSYQQLSRVLIQVTSMAHAVGDGSADRYPLSRRHDGRDGGRWPGRGLRRQHAHDTAEERYVQAKLVDLKTQGKCADRRFTEGM